MNDVTTVEHGDDLLRQLDDSTITRTHWKIMFISGMGFFTDAYDLFVIGVVMSMLKQEWHVSPTADGLVTSTALLASAIGAVLFGRIADMLGRKRIYGFEVLVLAAGAVASALSPDIWWLIVFRFVLGLGIGGDYPVSSTIMSEYAGKKTRGMLISMVFAMQAAGLVFGPALAAILLASGLSHGLTWRLLLAFGAVPAMAVFWMRRRMSETPRYLLATGQHDEFRTTGHAMLGRASAQPASADARPPRRTSFGEGFARLVARRDLLVRLIGASAAWFLMDFAYYGNTVSSPRVLAAIQPNQSLIWHVVTQLIVFVVAAVPGYFIAAWYMDRLGRKAIQNIGFLMMAISFGIMAIVPDIEKLVVLFLLVYGVSYFFTEFGPNSTTFVYPAELFPVESRTTGHGVAAAAGKVGAFVGVFLFPIFMSHGGLQLAEGVAALVSLLGLVVTIFMLPETKGLSLEELSATPAG
ncbi:MAG TPA: MFS transporter [Acetobacteraceae bacterium]|jgi:MFS family permease